MELNVRVNLLLKTRIYYTTNHQTCVIFKIRGLYCGEKISKTRFIVDLNLSRKAIEKSRESMTSSKIFALLINTVKSCFDIDHDIIT